MESVPDLDLKGIDATRSGDELGCSEDKPLVFSSSSGNLDASRRSAEEEESVDIVSASGDEVVTFWAVSAIRLSWTHRGRRRATDRSWP